MLKLEQVGTMDRSFKVKVNLYRNESEYYQYVKQPPKQSIEISVTKMSKIWNIKEAMYKLNEQLEPGSMDLKYKDIILDNNNTLEQLQINKLVELDQIKVDLRFISGIKISKKPCCITLDDNANESRAKMPCGHVFCSDAMTQILRSLVSNGQYEIRCPAQNGKTTCNQLWSYKECSKIAILTIDEKKKFEVGINDNYFLNKIKGSYCPICHNSISNDTNQLRVSCSYCVSQQQGYDFCWKCLNSWKSDGFNNCGNLQCTFIDNMEQLLKNCGTVTIENVTNVPKIRLCPSCKIALIEHQKQCKYHTCPNCQVEFCFICLGVKTNYRWPCGSYSDECPVAKRQTIQ